jgi:hypothetical protein
MTKREEIVITSQIKDFLNSFNLEEELKSYCMDRNFTELYSFLYDD